MEPIDDVSPGIATFRVYGFAADAEGLPLGCPKKRKKSESGFSRKRVPLPFNPFWYAVIDR
jgi:hypothetical protein